MKSWGYVQEVSNLSGLRLLLFQLAQCFVQRFQSGMQCGKERSKGGVEFLLGGVASVQGLGFDGLGPNGGGAVQVVA